jgi:hypothetical protein
MQLQRIREARLRVIWRVPHVGVPASWRPAAHSAGTPCHRPRQNAVRDILLHERVSLSHPARADSPAGRTPSGAREVAPARLRHVLTTARLVPGRHTFATIQEKATYHLRLAVRGTHLQGGQNEMTDAERRVGKGSPNWPEGEGGRLQAWPTVEG